jgi:hypothetical protein
MDIHDLKTSSSSAEETSALIQKMLRLEDEKYRLLISQGVLTTDSLRLSIQKLESDLVNIRNSTSKGVDAGTSTPQSKPNVNKGPTNSIMGNSSQSDEVLLSDLTSISRLRTFSHSPLPSEGKPMKSASFLSPPLTSDEIGNDDGVVKRNSHPGTRRLSFGHGESFRISNELEYSTGIVSSDQNNKGVLAAVASPRVPASSPDGTFIRRRSHLYRLPSAMLTEASGSNKINISNTVNQAAFRMSSSDNSILSVSSSPTSSASLESMEQFTNVMTSTSPPAPLECSLIEADFSGLVDDYSSSITSTVPPTLSWSFPKQKTSLSIKDISKFCFPSGVNLRFLHYRRAAKLIGSHTDERHILQFTDENGYPSYSCVLISQIAMHSPSVEVTRVLTDVSKRIQAANKLKMHIVKFILMKKQERWNSSAVTGMLSTRLSTMSDNSSIANNGPTTKRSSFFSRMTFWSSKPPTTPYASQTPPRTISSSPDKSRHSLSGINYSSHGSEEGNLSSSPIDLRNRSISTSSQPIGEKGIKLLLEEREQQEEMIAAANHNDHVIVSRRAYCIITREPYHAKVFHVLQAIADAERTTSIEVTKYPLSNRSTSSTTSSSKALEKARKSFLESVSTHLSALNTSAKPKRRRQSDPMDEKKMSFHVDRISIRGYADIQLHHHPLHYPKLKEWSIAVLLTYMSPTMIIKVINLLLIEKSLIIYGKQRRPGVVTAVSLAVRSLISPFTWEGVSVPLVPDDVRELFESPVPFIAGTITQPRLADVTSNTAVLVLDENLLTTTSTSLSVSTSSSSLTTFVKTPSAKFQPASSSMKINNGIGTEYLSWFLHLPELSTEMPYDDAFEQKIADARAKLQSSMIEAQAKVSLAKNITPDIYYTSRMTPEDRSIVSDFMKAVSENNFKVCEDVNTPASWKKYIKVSLLMHALPLALADTMASLGELFHWRAVIPATSLPRTNAMSHGMDRSCGKYSGKPLVLTTECINAELVMLMLQHFMSYVEQQQVEYLAEEHRLRLFIHDFILYHWIRKKYRKLSNHR